MSLLTPDEYFERIHRVASLLDETNVAILSAMKEYGPRNLKNLARKASLPYPTVYSRVTKLEKEGLLKTWVHPNYSLIGLDRAAVLLDVTPGRELQAREALKIPGFWLRTVRSVGDCNGYYSLHAIPRESRPEFEHYLDQVVSLGLATDYRILWLEEGYSPLPDFDYFDRTKRTWKFHWSDWLSGFRKDGQDDKRTVLHAATSSSFDKRDLVILKELVKDARTKLSSLAKLLGTTLPAAKYRFDSLVRRGMIYDYVIDILPYAPEVSDLSEVRMDFKPNEITKNRETAIRGLPFVLTYSFVRGTNSITARVYLPRSETTNLLAFLSALVRRDVLNSYSYSLLDPMTIQAQTFAYKDYSDDSGWLFDGRKYLQSLENLASSSKLAEAEVVSFQTTAGLLLQ